MRPWMVGLVLLGVVAIPGERESGSASIRRIEGAPPPMFNGDLAPGEFELALREGVLPLDVYLGRTEGGYHAFAAAGATTRAWFDPSSSSWLLVDASGLVRTFAAAEGRGDLWRLVRVEDRSGNWLSLVPAP